MVDNIIKFLQSLIPDSKLPTGDYLARLTGLTAIIIVIGMAVYFTVFGTVLGARWGLIRQPSDISNLSHLELIRDQRQIWQNLTLLRENDPTVKGVFSIVLYDTQSGNILTKDNNKTSSSLIYVASIPGNHFNSIDIIENAVNKIRPQFQEQFSNDRHCYSGKLKSEPLKILKRGIANLESTHFAACPIFAKHGGYLIAATFMFIQLPEPIPSLTITPDRLTKNEPNPVNQEAQNEVDEYIDLWGYQDRLQRVTSSLEQSLNDFRTIYQFYY